MTRIILAFISFFFLATYAIAEEPAPYPYYQQAQRGISIVYGSGTDIVELTNESASINRDGSGDGETIAEDAKIGFYMERFHIYYINLWTWGGKFVAFNSDGYFEPTQDQWKQILGEGGYANLRQPFSYIAPPGLVAGISLGLILGLLFLLGRRKPTDEDEYNCDVDNQDESSLYDTAA